MAAASASDHRWNDRLFSRRRDGHALQRHAHDCHGLRRRRARSHSQRKHSHPSTHAMARAHSLRFLPRPSRPRERPCRHHSFRRRHFLLGTLHKALARRLPPLSSRRSSVFLPHRSPLVHPLRPPQSRFFPHLHHRTQFQTLPHPRIPAHSTVLVLRANPSHCSCSVDTDVLERTQGPVSQSELSGGLLSNLFLLLGSTSSDLFQHLKVKIARICFAHRFPTGIVVVSFDFDAH